MLNAFSGSVQVPRIETQPYCRVKLCLLTSLHSLGSKCFFFTSLHSLRVWSSGWTPGHHDHPQHKGNCCTWPHPPLLSSSPWGHTYSTCWCVDQSIPSTADTSSRPDRQLQTICKDNKSVTNLTLDAAQKLMLISLQEMLCRSFLESIVF